MLDEKDLRIDTFRSSGKGGQHANTTDSGVRLTHLPTGLQGRSTKRRSQLQNKSVALEILKSKLVASRERAIVEEKNKFRKTIKPVSDRSQSVRTYHFLQSYVRDYRLDKNVRSGGIVEDVLTSPQVLEDKFIRPLVEIDLVERINEYLEKVDDV